MSTYHVTFKTGAFTTVSVEANSAEEARELADEQFSPPYVCALCSGRGKFVGESGIELGDDWEQEEDESGVWEA